MPLLNVAISSGFRLKPYGLISFLLLLYMTDVTDKGYVHLKVRRQQPHLLFNRLLVNASQSDESWLRGKGRELKQLASQSV